MAQFAPPDEIAAFNVPCIFGGKGFIRRTGEAVGTRGKDLAAFTQFQGIEVVLGLFANIVSAIKDIITELRCLDARGFNMEGSMALIFRALEPDIEIGLVRIAEYAREKLAEHLDITLCKG